MQKPADRYDPKLSPNVTPHQYKTDPEYKRSLLKVFVQETHYIIACNYDLVYIEAWIKMGPEYLCSIWYSSVPCRATSFLHPCLSMARVVHVRIFEIQLLAC